MAGPFPKGFLWGASTASYQIEGAAKEDGRGASIWDIFSHTPGKVTNGDTGDVACDHYHRYEEDVGLIKAAGMKAYRFSTAWPRVMPAGTGAINEKGLAFYDRLTDSLLKAGIEPWICLYHWDLPQALEDRGGWTNRDIAAWFADYAALIASRFGDRVKRIATFNEPNVFTLAGYGQTTMAPGRGDRDAMFAAIHHTNLAHGLALQAMRAVRNDLVLGIVNNLQPVYAKRPGTEDEAARRELDALWNRAFAEPMAHGRYLAPLDALIAPYIRPGDLERIRQKMDFFGLNHYSPTYARADAEGKLPFKMSRPPEEAPKTGMGWEINPNAFRDQIIEISKRYGPIPIYITENGYGGEENAGPDGSVNDQYRIDYIRAYLGALREAIAAGADVRGYFVWSLLDNFEWAHGYAKRFGIVHIDYATQKRTPKASYKWLQGVIKDNAV